jgi:O-antigen/teichoic acid export membrane protein
MKRTLGGALDGDSLKAKVFRGGVWLGLGSTLEQASRFGRNMLLTRILAPEAFGTMAIVMSATSVLASFLDVGAREALIQSPRGTEDGHVGATWWLCFGRSAFFYVCLFFLAPVGSWFYGNAQLTPLLRVAGLGLLLEGMMSTRVFVATKEMKFRKVAAITHGGGIIGVLTTIILSFILRDVWALVFGYLAENAARCILSYVVCPFIPPLRWDMGPIRELLGFSRGVFGLAILNLIFTRADIFVLAKMYPPAVLGVYAIAVFLVQTPTTFVINLLGGTMMPAFTHVQNDPSRMNRILLQLTAAIFLVGMPFLVFLSFCGRSLLTVTYGQRYGGAAGPLIVAGCAALLNVANAQITTMFYAKGNPQLHRRCVAIMATLMIVLTYPLVKWFGPVGGQLACLVSIVVGYLFQIERIWKLTGLSLSQYRTGFLVSSVISLSVVAICSSARVLGNWQHPVPNILVGMVGCLVAYALACTILFGATRDRARAILGF